MSEKGIIIQPQPMSQTAGNNEGLQLSPIKVDEAYCKKWHENLNDFVCLTKNGELISNSLYRVGGLGTPNLKKDNYFMLLKYVEAFYSDEIMKMSRKAGMANRDARHLEGRWVIIDKNGIEKVMFDSYRHGYLVSNSCMYSIEGKYYNIETGEFYCNSSRAMETSEFLFLENSYDKDESRRGVMKINKQDGSWELFKEK